MTFDERVKAEIMRFVMVNGFRPTRIMISWSELVGEIEPELAGHTLVHGLVLVCTSQHGVFEALA